ncbi:MAG: ABC transporter ATP-binding protein [Granulosicoccus sp.]|nr:ABC transporter ATP-binding protein [Granulosicoccus sp.]
MTTLTGDLTDRPWLDPDQTPFIQIKGVSKHFGDFVAVDDVSLNIYKGELFSLLGGSGCGKTTLLRMLAGFEEPTSGEILIDGINMSGVAPYQRPVNMMFQSYALFPHMTVEQNVAYGLKRDGVAAAEVKDRVSAMLGMVELSDFVKRKPNQLSGGQRQRVALARALVKNPKLLLLDEPLGALDKRLREQTQYELMNIQDQLGITFIVVTHDQEEAMTLSTRIAVMDQGEFVQTGTPTEIYEYPDSRFVAQFIGSANMFEGEVVDQSSDQTSIRVNGFEQPFLVEHDKKIDAGRKVWLALRPEKIQLHTDAIGGAGQNAMQGVVEDIGYYGNSSTYRIRLVNGDIVDVTHPNLRRPRDGRHIADWEQQVYLGWEPSSGVVLDR